MRGTRLLASVLVSVLVMAAMSAVPANAAPGGSCKVDRGYIDFQVGSPGELDWRISLSCTVTKYHFSMIAELQQKDRYGNWTIFGGQLVSRDKFTTKSMTVGKLKYCDVSTLRGYQYRVFVLDATVTNEAGNVFFNADNVGSVVHAYYCDAGNW